MGRRLLGLAVAGAALVACGTAFAELGQPAPWEYKLQEAGSPVMENITWFHNFLFVLITVITLFVLAAMQYGWTDSFRMMLGAAPNSSYQPSAH